MKGLVIQQQRKKFVYLTIKWYKDTSSIVD